MQTLQRGTNAPAVNRNQRHPAPLRFEHLSALLTDIGLWQHVESGKPHEGHGYSIDDQARGLIVGLRHWQNDAHEPLHQRLSTTCFQFIRNAALDCASHFGKFHNFCDADGAWLDSIGSDDSFGRTVWALGVADAVDAPFAPRSLARPLLESALPHIGSLQPSRSKAFAILGLSEARLHLEMVRALADSLVGMYNTEADEHWQWFESSMTYCNARLPHALFVAAECFPDEPRYLETAVQSLDFLLQVTRTEKGGYAPIGNAHLNSRGWFQRGDDRPPVFDQQPVDTGALVEACAKAYLVSGEPRFRQAAGDAFGWYHGHNIHELPVYDARDGSVGDALTPDGLNTNQGAESVLSYHLAYQALNAVFR